MKHPRSLRPMRYLCTLAAGIGALPYTILQPAHSEPGVEGRVTPAAMKLHETIGGGTVADPAVGPPPSFGLGGPNMVLVKNWRFGANGTIKNYTDMNASFYYHDEFGTINNGGKYGSNIVSPDFANAIGGQPIEGVNSPPVRKFTPDSLQTFLTPLNGVTKVQVRNHNTGNGSFMAKWRLPHGGSLLGRDIVWETRVRYKSPPYFWFSLWTAGNKWKWDGSAQGAEQDLVESFGYDNGNGNTNYDGRFFHSNAVANPSKDDWNFWDWGGTMAKQGIKAFDATQYHIWTWVYKKDNTYAMYVDGIRLQGGSNYFWTFGNTAKDEPIDMDFLFDAGWGHNQIGSVNKEMDASGFDGKFYEFNYSRVYLSGGGEVARYGPHVLPGTVQGVEVNIGGQGVSYNGVGAKGHWAKYTVSLKTGGRYDFSFVVNSPPGGGTFHVEDEDGVSLGGVVTAKASGGKATMAKAPAVVTLATGSHVLKWVQDTGNVKLLSMTVSRSAAPGAPFATFIKWDTATQGNWKGVYGADGYVIAGDDTRPPAYGSVTRTGWQVTWNGNGLTKDVRAPERGGGGADRMAGQWGTNDKSYDIDCNLTDNLVHQVSLYGLDWDLNGRSEDIQVVDAATGKVMDSQDLNAYVAGKYLVWNIQGHVIFRIINTSRWTNPALSGIFFDPVPTAAPRKTQGSHSIKPFTMLHLVSQPPRR